MGPIQPRRPLRGAPGDAFSSNENGNRAGCRDGAVVTDADVRGVATTMLGDPRARVGVGHFYRWWLGLDALLSLTKDPILFPEYSTEVGALMAKETETFGVYTTFDGDGNFAALM